MLKSIVYISSATPLMTPLELRALLAQARQNNERDGITGLLLYNEGNFMQAFEGEADRAKRLHNKILADPRHKNIITLLDEPIQERRFDALSMAFQNLSSSNANERSGAVSPILEEPFTKDYFGDNPGSAMKLLLTFRKRAR